MIKNGEAKQCIFFQQHHNKVKIIRYLGAITLRTLFLLKVFISSLTLNYSSAFAHICELSSNNIADIMIYNQCIADQNRNTKTEELIYSYENKIEKLTQHNIMLERRIAKIKSVLSTIISTY